MLANKQYKTFIFCLLLPFLVLSQTINLDSIVDRYIDLEQYKGQSVTLKGSCRGDRLVFRGANNVSLDFQGKIESTHSEDAICFAGIAHKLVIKGDLLINQSITFWGQMDSVEITGVHSVGAHVGVRATQNFEHNRVNIHHNTFYRCDLEGVYIGPSYLSPVKSHHVNIHHNQFVSTGWDAAQVGNCLDCEISRNLFLGVATKQFTYQDWTITVNPGSRAYLRSNLFLFCRNRLQCLDSRCFEW